MELAMTRLKAPGGMAAPRPVHRGADLFFVSGDGTSLSADDGRRYLDSSAGGAVVNPAAGEPVLRLTPRLTTSDAETGHAIETASDVLG